MKIKAQPTPNLWDTPKAGLWKKLLSMSSYIKSTERSQISDPMVHLKLLEKQKQAKPKTCRREKKNAQKSMK
jgi:hypothetical protein